MRMSTLKKKSSEIRGLLRGPTQRTTLRRFTLVRPVMRRGQAIVFHPHLIHGGSANLGETTRVSIEA